jgi:hypothetical protein
MVVRHFVEAQGDGEEMALACVPLFKAKQVPRLLFPIFLTYPDHMQNHFSHA